MGASGRLLGCFLSHSKARFCLQNFHVGTGILCRYFVPNRVIHTTTICLKQTKGNEISSEPYKFTASAANFPSLPKFEPRNEYQPFIVAFSLAIFLIYFILIREENDLDEQLNASLFDRVPHLEEPHLRQAIPIMRDSGIETIDAEIRLRELIIKRQEQEKKH